MPATFDRAQRPLHFRRLRTAALSVSLLLMPVGGLMGAALAKADHSVAAKFAYCQDCHGPSGQGFRGYYPIPRLGGQQVQYIKNQLEAFLEHRRKNAIMLNVAHGLDRSLMASLAEKFHRLDPRPTRPAEGVPLPAGGPRRPGFPRCGRAVSTGPARPAGRRALPGTRAT